LTHPDLEAYLLARPKGQVLREINEAENAAKRFTSLQRQYFERRSEEFSKQMATLKPGRAAGDSNAIASQMKSMVDRQMDSLEADQQTLQARLDEMNRPGARLTSEDVLVRDRLTKEVAEIDRLHIELARQSRNIPNPRPGEDLEVTRHRLLDLYGRLLQSTDSQRTLAGQEEQLVGSYYGNLRAAVESRPDDTPVQPPQAAGNTAVVTLPGSPLKNGVPPTVSQPNSQEVTPVPQPLRAFVPHFSGTFIRPEIGETRVCKPKSAELTINVDKATKALSGKLVINSKVSGECRADQFGQRAKPRLELRFKGKADGRTAKLECSSEGSKATIKFEFIEDNRAVVDLKPLSANWGEEEFVRLPEKNAQPHQDTPAERQSPGWTLAPPEKVDAPKKQ
jgi:hypothetical protein